MLALRASSLDLSKKTPHIQWTTEMRAFLCCLVKYYEERHDQFEAIFNKQFEAELAEFGFSSGILVKWPRLHAQWSCMRNHGDPIWGDVHKTALDPAPWLPFLEMIEGTAASLGLHITRKMADTIDSSNFDYQTPVSLSRPSVGNNRQAKSQGTPHQIVEAPQRLLVATQNTALESSKKSADMFLCTAGGKICFWCHTEELEKVKQKESDGLDAAQMPSLLFRWYNVKSQGVNSDTMFIAGQFTGILNAYFEPDTISEEEFCSAFKSHIRRNTVPSPFISTFKSALAPTHRSLRNQEGASVAIIDTSKLKSKVYSAKAFVQKHKLKIGPTYNGAGEYLIWGHINSEAIVCTFQVTTLQRIAAEHLDIGRFLQLETIAAAERNRRKLHNTMANEAVPLDKRAGATVGKLLSLLGVPQQYCKDNKRLPWGEFFEGFELGYKGEPVMDPRSPAPSPLHGADVDVDVDVDSDSGSSDTYSIDETSADEDNADVVTISALPVDNRNNELNAFSTSADVMATNTLPAVPAANHDNKPSVFSITNPNSFVTPARPPRRIARRLASPIHLEPLDCRAAIPISDDDNADDEMDDIDQEHDVFAHATVEQERRARDRFTVDRARVWEALNRYI
ncbi:hypothetical protein BDV06DRAFT_236070 [Aspergillus oleicola]